MHWGDSGWGMWSGWGMGFGWLVMILFWAIVIFGILSVVRLLIRGGKYAAREDTPIEILKKRYARGEISKEDFERMKEDIRKN